MHAPEMHEHQCGLTALGLIKGLGCGYVWAHPTTVDWKLIDHYCPRCGAGPFTFHVPKCEVVLEN